MSKVRRLINRRRARRAAKRTGVYLVLRWLTLAGLGLLGVIVLAGFTGVGAAVSAYAFYAQQLPEPGAITVVEEDFETTKIYDRTGEILLYEVIDPLGGDRTWVELTTIPLSMRYATIAIEDKTFYENPGYDLEGITRAAWNNLTGGIVQGGSSITQQLVKNVLIEPEERVEVTYDRKMKELILAIQISNVYSKDQILEWYLNTNFYGNLAYGVEAAAQVYYGKPVNELTLAEASMLAAIPQSPAINPIDNFLLAKERQAIVLDDMVEQGYITREQADIAFAAELDIKPPEQRFNLLAPHFSITVRKQLEQMFSPDLVYRGGLVVYTTLDYPLLLQIECAAQTHISNLSGVPVDNPSAADGLPCDAAQYLPELPLEHQGEDHSVDNASVVVMNVMTGEVLALMGSLDYYNLNISGNFNVALAERQPGSAVKPFTYVTAFEQGYTPATMVLDVRTAFDAGSSQPYVPENFDRLYHGPMSIRHALANSYNVPAVQVLEWVGIEHVLRTAHAMGINTLDRGLDYYGLSLTLGGGEVTLYDLTYSYAVLADNGTMHGIPTSLELRRPGFRTLDPALILRVEERDGTILWEYGKADTFASNPILEPSLAYLITDILADDASRRSSVGPESALALSRPAAVKTGTTNDFRDNWAVGYTPQIVTGVWVGNTDNTPMDNLPAIVGAAPLWHGIMEYVHSDLAVMEFEQPADITELTVCQTSGLLPTAYCPTRQEIFRLGTEPTTYDTIYQPFNVNRQTDKLATVYTPESLVEERIYQILPPAAADWAREANIAQPPIEYDTIDRPDVYGPIAITEPAAFGYVRGTVSIQGNATDPSFRSYRLDFGEGLNPTEWIQIGQTHNSPRYDGELGVWDARNLEGLYSLRLTVVRGNNTIEEFIIQVTVDNTPPSIQILTPTDGQEFTLGDEYITIQPFVTDNISMDRVEFYVDDELIATSTISPFNERWLISGPGLHTLQIRAYDAIGNTVASERMLLNVSLD